ncbi:MAG: hypothetical protein KDI37_08975 [Xanthomonadales bacterium]|nr:hypothetical protein [Xanthomonadales bacterium]MCB1641851.1 hypothetical protein [Xanthomonadales bacterium]
MDPSPAQELHQADPAWRKNVLWLAAGAVLLGVLLLLAYQWGVQRMLLQLAERRVDDAVHMARWLGGTMALLLCLSCAALAWLSSRTAAQVLQQDRFPPAQARMIRDTPVLRGEAARRRARLLQLIALILPLTAIMATALLIQLLWTLA